MKQQITQYFLVALLVGASFNAVFSNNTSALTYSSATDIEFTFNSVISVNLSSPNLVISDLTPGSASDSNIVTVGATTNGSAGYQLSATVGVKNGTSALVNTSNSSNTFANLTSTKATLNDFSDNTWGYSYCADTSANCNGGSGTWVSGSKGSTTAGYAGLPLDNNDNAADRGNGGVLLLNTSGPEDTVQSVQFKIGAKASSGQASGDYTNTINFYAVANPEPQLGPVSCEAGKICYDKNALGGVEGTMGKQTAGNNASVTLLASNFSRSGYGFAGWNTAYDYSGTNYGPQEDITTPANTSTNGLSLYAIWVKSTGSIQNWSGCSSLPQGSVIALTDQRDNNTYAIAKLADGNCWMIENLRLENTGTDNTNGSLSQGYNPSFIGLAEPETPWANNSTDANSLYTTEADVQGKNTISGSNQGYRFPRYNNVNTPTNTADRPQNPTTNSATNSTSNAGMYSYGNYYTWAAAIADTTNYTTNNQSVTNTSICPTGWHLPTGGSAYASGSTSGVNVTGDTSTFREFYNLGYKTMDEVKTAYEDTPNNGYAYYSSNTTNTAGKTATAAFRSFPNNFVYSGYVYSGSVYYRGSVGNYWSSTANSSYSAYYLHLNSSNVFPGTAYNNYKYYGWTVRCVVSGV